MSRPRLRWGTCCLGLFAAVLTTVAEAQQAVPSAPAGNNVVTLTRPLWMESVLTLAMIGLALFVVCRSSRRN